MAWCFMAPIHYQNQWGVTISTRGNIIGNAQNIPFWMCWKITQFISAQLIFSSAGKTASLYWNDTRLFFYLTEFNSICFSLPENYLWLIPSEPSLCLQTSWYIIGCLDAFKKHFVHFVNGICAGNSPHKGPVTRNMFPIDDIIMNLMANFYSRWYFCAVLRVWRGWPWSLGCLWGIWTSRCAQTGQWFDLLCVELVWGNLKIYPKTSNIRCTFSRQ